MVLAWCWMHSTMVMCLGNSNRHSSEHSELVQMPPGNNYITEVKVLMMAATSANLASNSKVDSNTITKSTAASSHLGTGTWSINGPIKLMSNGPSMRKKTCCISPSIFGECYMDSWLSFRCHELIELEGLWHRLPVTGLTKAKECRKPCCWLAHNIP